MSRHPGARYVGICGTCGKHQFPDRKSARAAARDLHPHAVLRAYQCGIWWHYGHTSPWIKKGLAR